MSGMDRLCGCLTLIIFSIVCACLVSLFWHLANYFTSWSIFFLLYYHLYCVLRISWQDPQGNRGSSFRVGYFHRGARIPLDLGDFKIKVCVPLTRRAQSSGPHWAQWPPSWPWASQIHLGFYSMCLLGGAM